MNAGTAADLLRSNRLPLILLCALGAWLRIANLNNVVVRSPDESTYTHQAQVWLASGTAGMRTLVHDYDRDPRLQDLPTPTRAGIIQLTALMIRLTGRNDAIAGAALSCAASILSLAVAAIIAGRFLPPSGALFGLLFYVVSPAELGIARRLWPDAMVELPSVLALWIACEAAAGARRRAWLVAFAAVGAAGLAIRETFPIPYGFCLLWMLWVLLAERRDRVGAVLLVALSAIALAASFSWLAMAVGSLRDFVRIASNAPAVAAANAYVQAYATGPPWLILVGFWIASPIPTLFAGAGLVAAFAARHERPNGRVLAGMAAATVACLAVMTSERSYSDLRYFSVLFVPFYLLAGYGFCRLAALAANWMLPGDRGWLAAVAAAALLAAATTDYLRFQRIFVRDSLGDMAIKLMQYEQDR